MSGRGCKCGGKEIDEDRARGVSVCMQCGAVIEDLRIVNEAEITETAGGGIKVIGHWLSQDETRANTTSGMQGMNSRTSRQITMQKARRGISDMASHMRMNQHCVDAAFNFYKMALTQGLSRGNKSSHLLAACLYIVCRTEGTQHILLDFCDHVDADISVLARIYLRLARALHLNVPHTDPSLLIPRYASKLGFGDRCTAVSNTALRIVQRMKRDWLHIGRRSSGLCGSALLFAARMHNFNRTIQQIVEVVKISKATIVRRLQEFETTPTAQLNPQEFDSIDLESEEDPPAFSKAKKMSKLALDEETDNIEQIEHEILETQKKIEEQLEKLHKPRGQLAKYAKYAELEKTVLDPDQDLFIEKILNEKKTKRKLSIDDFVEGEPSELMPTEKAVEGVALDETDMKWAASYIDEQQTKLIISLLNDQDTTAEAKNQKEDPSLDDDEEDYKDMRPTLVTLGIEPPKPMSIGNGDGNQNGPTFRQPQVVLDLPEWKPSIDLTKDELDLTGIDDNEIEEMILTREETKLKLKSWLRENKDWFLEEKRRQRNREANEQKKNSNGGLNASQRRKRKKKAALNEAQKYGVPGMGIHQLAGFTSMTPAGLAAAAQCAVEAEKQSQDRRVSSKINYDVLKRLTMKKEELPPTSTTSVDESISETGSTTA